ncbi:MAG: response regulator transcription factor [Verrucomicrobiae bacterium]|nr:response regulator transcription factor [Verrucomicrobiae bacterium]
MIVPPPITVMLVDDHFVVRSGLAVSLDLEEDMEIVAEAEDGRQAIERYRQCHPKVVVMDLQLPGFNGIEATERLREIDPDARVLIFSTFARDDEIQAALEAGALGYLQKSAGRDELITALRTVAAGRAYLPAGLAEHLAGLQLGPAITTREREILARVAQGRANKEIASALGIAEDTVKRHVSNIFQKLDVNDRAQATAEAIRRGIVRLDP